MPSKLMIFHNMVNGTANQFMECNFINYSKETYNGPCPAPY